MKKRNILLFILFILLSTLIFNTFQKDEIINIIISVLCLIILLLYLNTKDDVKLVISKNLILRKFKQKIIKNHYVIFLEIANLITYSQFYDVKLGDQILKKVYAKLVKKIGKSNVFLYGTEQIIIILEFKNTVVLNQQLRYEEQYRSTKQIINSIGRQSIKINDSSDEYNVSLIAGCAAVGIKDDIDDLNSLIKLAHFSMLKAKDRKEEIVVATEEIHTIKEDLDSFNQEIEKGFQLDEFSPFFFPIIDAKTLRIVGCESLVRWQKNQYRIIEASKFKDIAIEKNLFEKIDKRVIEKTFSAYNKWREEGLIDNDFMITINLSLKSLLSFKPYELVQKALEFNINPQFIEFDISEDIIISEKALKAIKKLKSKKFKVSVDAFNNNSFSLRALINIDIDIIKIDKSNLPSEIISDKEYQFYKTLTEFAQVLNVKTLSKGIENKYQLKFAKQLKVDYVQGYYFTRPLDDVNIVVFLKKYRGGILIP